MTKYHVTLEFSTLRTFEVEALCSDDAVDMVMTAPGEYVELAPVDQTTKLYNVDPTDEYEENNMTNESPEIAYFAAQATIRQSENKTTIHIQVRKNDHARYVTVNVDDPDGTMATSVMSGELSKSWAGTSTVYWTLRCELIGMTLWMTGRDGQDIEHIDVDEFDIHEGK